MMQYEQLFSFECGSGVGPPVVVAELYLKHRGCQHFDHGPDLSTHQTARLEVLEQRNCG